MYFLFGIMVRSRRDLIRNGVVNDSNGNGDGDGDGDGSVCVWSCVLMGTSVDII